MATNKTEGHILKNPHYIAKQMFYGLKGRIEETDIRTAMALQPVLNLVLEYFLTFDMKDLARLEKAIELYSDYDEVKPIIPHIESIKELYYD